MRRVYRHPRRNATPNAWRSKSPLRRDTRRDLRRCAVAEGVAVEGAARHPVALRMSNIAQAAVVISDDQRLVAYVVPRSDPPPRTQELRRHVRQKLPEHMTPAFYLPIDAIPLSTRSAKTEFSPNALRKCQICCADRARSPPSAAR